MFKLFLAIAVACTSLLSSAVHAQQKVLRIGYIPIISAVPHIFTAVDQGYFEAEGIKPAFTPLFSGADILAALAGGSLDIGFSATASGIVAKEKGLDLLIVADGFYSESSAPANDALILSASANIRTPKDLEGKTIAVNAINSYAWMNTKQWLQDRGVDVSKVTWQEMGFPQMPQALVQGAVAAASVASPFFNIVLRQFPDKVTLLAYHALDVRQHQMVSPWFAMKRWTDQNPDLVVRFNRAMRKAAVFVNANPQYGKTLMVRNAKTDPSVAELLVLSNRSFSEKVDVAALEWQIDMMLKHGIIKQKITATSLLHPVVR